MGSAFWISVKGKTEGEGASLGDIVGWGGGVGDVEFGFGFLWLMVSGWWGRWEFDYEYMFSNAHSHDIPSFPVTI